MSIPKENIHDEPVRWARKAIEKEILGQTMDLLSSARGQVLARRLAFFWGEKDVEALSVVFTERVVYWVGPTSALPPHDAKTHQTLTS